MEEGKFKFRVTEEDRRKRLDKYLVEKLPEELSRSFIQKLIADGNILLNGAPAKSHHKVSAGESIEVTVPKAEAVFIRPEKIPLDIVYEDEYLLVVNKPAGMVVHPAPGNYDGTLVNALIGHCKNLSGISGVMKPGIVHRTDKGTTGLLVVAKTDQAHRALAKQFKAKQIKKVYVAVVKGVVQLDNGIIELPIGRHSRDRKKMAVNFVSSKDASTRYAVLERFKDHTLLELTLLTGRTHQIRVHMSYIDHPLVGDEKYGTKARIGRPALHAKTIGFVHPVTKKYMEFTADLPKDMKGLINELKKDKTDK